MVTLVFVLVLSFASSESKQQNMVASFENLCLNNEWSIKFYYTLFHLRHVRPMEPQVDSSTQCIYYINMLLNLYT